MHSQRNREALYSPFVPFYSGDLRREPDRSQVRLFACTLSERCLLCLLCFDDFRPCEALRDGISTYGFESFYGRGIVLPSSSWFIDFGYYDKGYGSMDSSFGTISVTGAFGEGPSDPQIVANSTRKRSHMEEKIFLNPAISGRAGLYTQKSQDGSRRSRNRSLDHQTLGWEGIQGLGNQVLMTLCITILLILSIVSELIFAGVSFLDSRWTGNGFELYDRTSRQDQETWESHSEPRKCCDVGPEVITARKKARNLRIGKSEHPELSSGSFCKGWQKRRSKRGVSIWSEQAQQAQVFIIRIQRKGMHSRASTLKRKSTNHGQGRTASTPPALRVPTSSNSDDTPSSSTSESGNQQQQSENQQESQEQQQLDLSTSSELSPDMAPTDSGNSNNRTEGITVLRAVIPTPASAGLVFDGRGATRWIDEVCAFFKDWNCTGSDRHERILRHMDIAIRDDVKAIPEYTKVPFDEGAFFAALKKKYRDYDDDYTKHTRPFLDALVLSAQRGQVESKDFIELFHRVSASLKDKKLLDEIERANLFLCALPDRIRSKIVKKHHVDQDDGKTLVYEDFYKTALGVCEADEVINRYKENRNPVMLSSKVSTVNNIMKALNTERGVVPTAPVVYPAPSQEARPVPAMDKMFPVKHDFSKSSGVSSTAKVQDPRDDLARQLEELRIAQANAVQEVRKEISQELRTALNQNSSGFDNRGFRQGGRGYGGFRGERGPGFNQRPYNTYQQAQAPQNNQSVPVNDTINASAVYGSFNGGGNYGGNFGPNCFACYNIDRDGNPEQFPHGHSNRCPQLQELIQNGVCHKNSDGRLCLGPWREGAEEIMLRRDAPWVRQIISRTRGTRYDPDITRRAGNIRVEQDQEQEAAQARANANATGANASAAPIRSIMKRPDTPGIPIHHYSVVDDEGREIDDLLEERIHAYSMGVDSDSEWAVVAANASQTRPKAKPVTSSNPVQSKVTKVPSWSEARRNKAELQKKADAEAKLARPKTRRPSAYVPEEISEADDMSVDETIEEVPRPELSKTNVVRSLEEFDRISPDTVTGDKPQRKTRLTVHQPRKSKGYRSLINQLGSGYPAEAVREKLLADLVQYRELFEVTDAARAALKSLIEGRPIAEEAVVNIQSVSLDSFATRGWIVATPKLPVTVIGPKEGSIESAMLDTGAEANVMSYELAKELGCPILSTEHLKLKTVSGQVLQFAGMAKVEIEIEHGVGCTTVFFLVRETKGQSLPMIILGQPFTQAMRMTFEHGSHGSMDAVFHDPRSHQTCTVSVVPPVKKSVRSWQNRHAYVEDASSEEEN